MIDLHTHILYGLDDGAKDGEMMLSMLRIAQEDGITGIVATPHYIYGANKYDNEMLQQRYNEAVEIINSNNIEIELYQGNELFLDEYCTDSLKNGEVRTLAGSRYVLTELPMLGFPKHTESVLYRMLCEGYIPVLAHVERYADIQKDLEILKRFIEMGCIAQVNATSITGIAGKSVQETTKSILRCNMGHLAASDCHSDRRRSPKLSAAFEIAREWVGDDNAENIFINNPQAVIDDGLLQIEEPFIEKKKSIFNIKLNYKLPWGV